MNVFDVINELQKYDGNMIVLIDGYEGGMEKLESIKEIEVVLDPDHDREGSDLMFGEYYPYYATETPSIKGIKAVYFPRRGNA